MDMVAYLMGKKSGGGGDEPSGTTNITENGTHNVSAYAYADVAVPNSYSAGDEGKVVSSGVLVSQISRVSEITENGTYDTTLNNEVQVNVSGEGQDPSEFGETGISDSGLGWSCYSDYYTDTADELLGTVYGRDYRKYSNGAAIVIHQVSTSSSYGGTGPIIFSTVQDNTRIKTSRDELIHTGMEIGTYLGMTWYCCLMYLYTSSYATEATGGRIKNQPLRYRSDMHPNEMTNDQIKQFLCSILGAAGVHLTPQST